MALGTDLDDAPAAKTGENAERLTRVAKGGSRDQAASCERKG